MKVNHKEIKEKMFLFRTMAMSDLVVRKVFQKVQGDKICSYILYDLDKIHSSEIVRYNEIIQHSNLTNEVKEKLLIGE